MAIQVFDDGSLSIYNNAKSDSGKLNLICESLKTLTEPQKINEMVETLLQRGILNDKDVAVLETKGIIHQEQEINLKQANEVEKMEKNNKEIDEELEL